VRVQALNKLNYIHQFGPHLFGQSSLLGLLGRLGALAILALAPSGRLPFVHARRHAAVSLLAEIAGRLRCAVSCRFVALGGGALLAVAVAVKHQRTMTPLTGERWRLQVWRLWLPRVVRGAAHWVEAATPLLFGPHGGRPPSHREGGRHVRCAHARCGLTARRFDPLPCSQHNSNIR